MRYDDWDVLIFPAARELKVPLKEFRVACHVISDGEPPHSHGSLGIPIVTCFVPSLPAGTRFNISIHSWKDPALSHFARSYSKHSNLVKYEVRVFVDGRMVAATSFDRAGPWPHVVSNTFELRKSSELEPLRFPIFRREILQQEHWNPGDDFGRIKVLVSEGFPRSSLSAPIERVKNVVAFSFQHAPLDILEQNGIAWPNPSMWRRPHLDQVPVYSREDDVEMHAHSPRRRAMFGRSSTVRGFPNSLLSDMAPSPGGCGFLADAATPHGTVSASQCMAGPSDMFAEPLGELPNTDWVSSLTGFTGDGRTIWPTNNMARGENPKTDTSTANFFANADGQLVSSEPMHISRSSLDEDPVPHNIHQFKVTTKTPASGDLAVDASIASNRHNFDAGGISSHMSADLATSLTESLLNQPLPLPIHPQSIPPSASEAKSRERSGHFNAPVSHPPSGSPTPLTGQSDLGVFLPQSACHVDPSSLAAGVSTSDVNSGVSSPSSQQLMFSAIGSRDPASFDLDMGIAHLGSGSSGIHPLGESSFSTRNAPFGSHNGSEPGIKRLRNFTPASVKAIDQEDEPRLLSPQDGTSRSAEDTKGSI